MCTAERLTVTATLDRGSLEDDAPLVTLAHRSWLTTG
jgi:hypothetical protein